MGATSGLSKFSYRGEEIDLNGDLGNHLNQNSDVHAVIDWFGPTDLLRFDDCPKIKRKKRNEDPRNAFIGGPIQKNKIITQMANPITYLNSKHNFSYFSTKYN